MNIRTIGAISLLAVGAFLAGKYLFPNVKTEVRTVVKTVEVEKVKEKRNVVTVTNTKKLKDGSEVTETKIVENTETAVDKSSQVVAETSKVSSPKSGLTLGLLAIKNTERFSDKLEYGVTVTAPLIGRLKVQAMGTTEKRVGLGVAIEF